MANATDTDKTLQTIALYNLATMSVLGCLGAGAFVAAGRLDVTRSIAVAAATVGVAGTPTTVAARRCSDAAMVFGFILEMAAVLGVSSVLDSWAGLSRRALVTAVTLGVAASLAIGSWGALRQRRGFQECKDSEGRGSFEERESFGEREGLEERNGGRDDKVADAPS